MPHAATHGRALRTLLFSSTALLATAFGAHAADVPDFPKAPITLNIFDVAGDLALTQKAIEAYRASHRNLIDRITYTKAPTPELAGKLKAMQNAGRMDIDLVLTGLGGILPGIDQDLWVRVLPDYAQKFPNIDANYLLAALNLHKFVQGYGVVVVYYPSGPLLEYAPERVKDVPRSSDALLAWCKAHPNRLTYARPSNSGPGWTFLMGLPYLLGDKDPKDPVQGWDKTWAYLKELDSCIEYYPSGTGATMKEFGEGSRDIVLTTTGWDINPRVLGVVPKSAEIAALQGFHWVSDAHYMAIPKGIAPERLAVVLDLMAHLLKPEAQAVTYDEGYFYPGPSVKDVPITMAPKESQDAIREFGRPEYDKLIADNPIELPLDPASLVKAFRRWDEEIGAKKLK